MRLIAILSGDKAFISTEEFDKLQKRFGILVESGKLQLSALETLYLLERDKIVVKDKFGREYSFEDLIRYFMKFDKNIFPKYLIFRDLTERGYKVIDGYSKGIDLLVFDKGDYPSKPAKYRILGIDEGKPVVLARLVNELKSTLLSKKELKIAVIERRGEVIYYSLSLGLKKLREKKL